MLTFTFLDSTGTSYAVTVPNGTTEAQARAAYENQLNIGGLAQLGPGQSVQGQSAKVAQTTAALAKLAAVPLRQSVSTSSVLKQASATIEVGSLTLNQVTGLLAQSESLAVTARAALPAGTSPLAVGVGTYGLSPTQLEQQGYLKPGTVSKFLGTNPSPDQLDSILSSPSVWSGKDGVSELATFVSDRSLQSSVQQSVMNASLIELNTLGVVNGTESAQTLGGLVQAASKFSPMDVASWAAGDASSSIVGQINNVTKSGQQAVNLVTSGLNSLPGVSLSNLINIPALQGNPALATLTSLTNINSSGIAASLLGSGSSVINGLLGGTAGGAVTSILGGNVAGIATSVLGTQAGSIVNSFLKGNVGGIATSVLGTQAGSIVNSLLGSGGASIGGLATSVLGGSSGIINGILGSPGGSIVNSFLSGKVSGITTSLLGSGSGIVNGLLGSGGGSVSNLAASVLSGNGLTSVLGGSLTGSLSGATGALSSISGSLTQVTGELTGALSGAIGQLSGTIGAVTGELTGALSGVLSGISGDLAGALGGQLSGAVSGLLGDALGSLGGSLGSIMGGLGSLFGGGGRAGFNPAGSTGTVNRAGVDAAVNFILNDPKIPKIIYGPIVRRYAVI
jgi:hypothetical protein